MLKLIVRRFESEALGDVIIDCLTSIGFGIAERVSPDSDSMGGLIETEVMNDFDLLDEVEQIIEKCHQVCPDCLVLWEGYEVAEEGSSDINTVSLTCEVED